LTGFHSADMAQERAAHERAAEGRYATSSHAAMLAQSDTSIKVGSGRAWLARVRVGPARPV